MIFYSEICSRYSQNALSCTDKGLAVHTQKKGEVSNQNTCQDLKAETPQETVFKLLNMKSCLCVCVCTFVNRTVSSWPSLEIV